MTNRISRRGSKAVEFALILPVMLAFLTGIMDYGWYFSQQISMTTAVRDAARAGSTTPQDEGPVQAAEETLALGLDAAGFKGTITTDIQLVGADPDQAIDVHAGTPFDPLVGFVPVPSVVAARLTMRMEDQPG